MYTPSSEIRIGRVPWNRNKRHIRWYANATAQANGIASFMDASKTHSNYTYQRLQRAIDVPFNAESMYSMNYVMFQNAEFGNKWFYAFVTGAEYLNQNTTRLHLELDYAQTFMHDYDIKPCLVEREHVSDDAIGAHLKEEGLDTGEMKCVYAAVDNDSMDCYMVVASAVEPLRDGTYVNNGGDKYMGVTSGTSLSVFLTIDDFKAFMQALSDNGQQDAVSKVYMCPRAAIPNIVRKSNGWGYWVDANSATPSTVKNYALGFDGIDGYYPKNNKCYCYPYEFAEVTNFTGKNQQLRLELFATPGTVSLERTGGCDANSRLMYVPLNYNGVNRFVEGAVPLDSYPTCNWVYQAFANLLGQNEITLPSVLGSGTVSGIGELPLLMSFLNTAVGVAGNVASLNPAGLVGNAAGLANDAVSAVSSLQKASKTPNTGRGGTNSTTALVNIGSYTVGVRKYVCRAEIIEQIDDYFSVYGYNVSVVKTPNVTGRASWNFVKTNGANVTGNVPSEYLAAFNSLLDSGVTFWHTDDVGNYALDNSIV